MGKVCNQPRRDRLTIKMDDADRFVKNIKNFAKDNEISYEEALKTFDTLAYERRTDAIIDAGDNMDECLCGLYQSLSGIADSIESKE